MSKRPEAARLAAIIRAGMKDQALSDTELAARVERLTGRPYLPQYVGRRLNGTRPLVVISPDLYLFCEVLGLDPAQVVAGAMRDAIAEKGQAPS